METNDYPNRTCRTRAPGILLAVVELAVMAAIILLDLLIPSILAAAVGAAFVLIRKERMPIDRPPKTFTASRFTLLMLLWACAWTVVQYSLILPLQNHLLNDTRDIESFAAVQGDLSQLLLMLAASWTLAAVGEEFAFRGFFQNRIISLFSDRRLGIVIAVAVTSVFFGVMHAEQGFVGIIVTAVDSAFFSFIRYRYKSVWASVLVHGFMNSIGFVTFFFTGPLYGLW